MLAGLNADERMLNMAESEFYRIQQDKSFRKNTRFANAQSMRMQRESDVTRPANQVSGFMNAGFSPLASLGNMSMTAPTSSNVALPMPKASAPTANDLETFNQLKLGAEQIKNLEAQTEKQNILNNRMKNEDAGAYNAVKTYADSKLSDKNLKPSDRAYWEGVKSRPANSFNVGDINAEMNFKNLVTKDVDTTANAIKKSYENYLWNSYKQGDKAFLDIGLQEAQLGKFFSEIANIETNTLLQSMEVQLKPHEMQKLDSETARNLAEAESTYHGDIAALWKNGDFQALLAKGGTEVLKTALEVAASRLGGLGYAAKVSAASRAKSGAFKDSLDSSASKAKKQTESILNPNKAARMNERRRKYVENRENERRKILRNSALPAQDYMI